MSQMQRINPYFLVDDVFASAEYYRDVLSFSFDGFWGEPPAFVMVRRDDIQIMLRQPPSPCASVAAPNRARLNFTFDAYVYVENVDTLYEELKANGANILFAPCDQPHDCREIEVQDLNGYIICFGQNLLT